MSNRYIDKVWSCDKEKTQKFEKLFSLSHVEKREKIQSLIESLDEESKNHVNKCLNCLQSLKIPVYKFVYAVDLKIDELNDKDFKELISKQVDVILGESVDIRSIPYVVVQAVRSIIAFVKMVRIFKREIDKIIKSSRNKDAATEEIIAGVIQKIINDNKELEDQIKDMYSREYDCFVKLASVFPNGLERQIHEAFLVWYNRVVFNIYSEILNKEIRHEIQDYFQASIMPFELEGGKENRQCRIGPSATHYLRISSDCWNEHIERREMYNYALLDGCFMAQMSDSTWYEETKIYLIKDRRVIHVYTFNDREVINATLSTYKCKEEGCEHIITLIHDFEKVDVYPYRHNRNVERCRSCCKVLNKPALDKQEDDVLEQDK